MEKFYVNAHWDNEAEVYYSKSNIDGLHVEADNLEEFMEIVYATAPELYYLNHLSRNANSGLSRWLTALKYRLSPILKKSYYPLVILVKESGTHHTQA